MMHDSPQVFIIKYEVLYENGVVIKKGTMKVKNKYSEFEAMASLDTYLKEKVPGFAKLRVISCVNENPLIEFMSACRDMLWKK